MSNSSIISNLGPEDLIVMMLVFIITSCSIRFGLKRKLHNDWNKNLLKKERLSLNSPLDRHYFRHMIMARTLTLPLFIATLVASWYGGIFGVTEISYNTGIYCFLTQGIFWYISYIIFALFVVKTISKYAPYTFPDMIHELFGKRSSYLSSIFNFFNVLPIAYTLSLGLLIHTIFGLNLYLSTIIGSFCIITYTIKGGMLADVYSDLIHFIVMCSSVLLVVVFAYYYLGDFSTLHQKLPSHYFTLQSDQSISSIFMWLFIALSTLVNPSFYQKCFATNSYKITRTGIFISIIIWMIFDCCTVLGGMYAKLYYDSLYSSGEYFSSINAHSSMYLIMALDILPPGLKGFFIAGILATIISTLDSNLLISSNTLCFDIIDKRYRSIRLQRISIILVALLAICLSFIFNGSVKQVWKHIGSLTSGSLTVPVFFGLIHPHILKDNQFIITVLSSFVLMLVLPFFLNIEKIFIGILTGIIFTIIFILVNKLNSK